MKTTEIDLELLNQKLSMLWEYNEMRRCVKLFAGLSMTAKEPKQMEYNNLVSKLESLESHYNEAKTIVPDIIAKNIDYYVAFLKKTYPGDIAQASLDPYEIITETILSLLERGTVKQMALPLSFENGQVLIGFFIELMKFKRLRLLHILSGRRSAQNTEDDYFFENSLKLKAPHNTSVEVMEKRNGVNSAEIEEYESRDEQENKDRFLRYWSVKLLNQVTAEKKNFKPFRALQRKLKWQYGSNSSVMDVALKTYQPSIIGKIGTKVFLNRYKAWNKIVH